MGGMKMKLSNYDLERFKNVKLEPSEVLETFKELAHNYIEESWLDPQFREDYENVEKALENYTELVKRDEGMRVVKTESEGFIELQCPECYHEVLPLDEFCSSCGQRLERSDVK